MVFTVIQYLPILEEETPGHRVELTKKMKENYPSSDGDADDDDNNPDPDPKGDINYYPVSNFIYVLNQPHFFYHKDPARQHRVDNVNTPPPQI